MARLLVILLLVFLVAVYGQKSREQRARPDAAEDFEKPRQSSHGKDKSRGEYRARHGVFSKTDKSDWVDSGDMFNYDHSTKQMKKPSTKGTTVKSISLVECKTAVTPLHQQWSYWYLVLSQWYTQYLFNTSSTYIHLYLATYGILFINLYFCSPGRPIPWYC